MPVRERAFPLVRGEVPPEPGLLRRAGVTAADFAAVAVERDDVPGADVVAVPAPSWPSGAGAPVREVARGASSVVLVIPGGRPGQGPQGPPAGLVTLREVVEAAVLVGKIAERSDRPDATGPACAPIV